MSIRETSVVIVGAGPAGLTLGLILHHAGIDFVIVEAKSKQYLLDRLRAGLLEDSTVRLCRELGVGDRILSDGLIHAGVYLQSNGQRQRINFDELVGKSVTVYGQQQLVRDLIAAHELAETAVYFEASAVAPQRLSQAKPVVSFIHSGELIEFTSDVVVGADGSHGVCRTLIPEGTLANLEFVYPFAWLGILVDVPPSTDELIYAHHSEGFALHSMRSSERSRLYLQVEPDDDIASWSDDRIWEALDSRLGTAGWVLNRGPITQKSITPMRSAVASTLNYGSLFLVGDAGHIVPPTGAKGLNSAVADVALLGEAIREHYAGDSEGLTRYSERALRRQWRVQHFSRWMTDLMHTVRTGDARQDAFLANSQHGQFDYVLNSSHAMASLAEQYTGISFEEGAKDGTDD